MTPAPVTGRGTALALLSSLTFGMSGVLAKSVMATGAAPAQVTSARIALAAAVLVAGVGLFRPRALRFGRGDWGLLVGFGLFGVVGAPLTFFVAASRIPVGIAMLLQFTAPVLVALWVRFVRGTRLPAAVWWGTAVAVVGLTVVAEVWSWSPRLDPVGVLVSLCSAVCLMAYYLLGERAGGAHDSYGVLAGGMVVGAVVLTVVSPPWLLPLGVPTSLGPTWLVLVVLALVATVVAYLTGVLSLRHLPPSAASVIGLLEVVVAAVLAWWLLDERLTVVQVVGAVVLLAGAAVVQVASARKPLEVAVAG
ncbi:EamA family transporter [Saccharothrix longispora]|uniref:EamA family transporter n=1 Tax=Saccharothrix longispora TaxID=33920 RepID=UPI0028FD709A|nr:EamA family transporter [Saccharothrix longispora]MDU0289968.1 EamA family transporter [Saccharothrix longispora]